MRSVGFLVKAVPLIIDSRRSDLQVPTQDGAADDFFGHSLAFSGVIAGAHWDDDNASDPGPLTAGMRGAQKRIPSSNDTSH